MILNRGSETFDSPRKVKTWDKLRQLIEELGTMELKPAVQEEMVRSVQELNVFQGSDAKLISLARKKMNGILRVLEKEMNLKIMVKIILLINILNKNLEIKTDSEESPYYNYGGR